MQRSTLPDRNTRPLKRGKACLTCRFLKIKCDGARPICGPCLRHPKDDPCEFTDGPGRSRTRALEEKIERLEARIHELEDPERATPSITLHHPYPDSEEDSLQLSMPPPHHRSVSLASSSASPDSSFPLSPSSPFSGASTLSSRSSPGFKPVFPLSPLSSPTDTEGPSPHTLRNILDRFFQYSAEFGFFLNPTQFYYSALGSEPLGHPKRPLPALFRVVCLWGIHLLPEDPYPLSESDYVQRSVAETASAISSSHPQNIIQTIQAEVLLSYYFWRTGRCLEARQHSGSAASLALGCGLHKVRSSVPWTPAPLAVEGRDATFLPETFNTVEEGERLNGFWAVSTLMKNLAASLDQPSSVCGVFEAPGLAIDAPWPMDMESYKQGRIPHFSSLTIQNFLSQPKHESDGAPMAFAEMYAKASVLFHRATYLSGQYSPAMQTHKSQAFVGAFEFLDRLLDAFRSSMPSISQLDPTLPGTRTICLSYALICGATIRLHSLLAYSNVNSRQACIASARAMLHLGAISWQDFRFVNPIMGTLFLSACQVFVDEISRLQATRSAAPTWSDTANTAGSSSAIEEELMTDLQIGMSALSFFSRESSLMSKSIPPRFLWSNVGLDATSSYGPTHFGLSQLDTMVSSYPNSPSYPDLSFSPGSDNDASLTPLSDTESNWAWSQPHFIDGKELIPSFA